MKRKKIGRPKGQTPAQKILDAAKIKRALELQIRGFSYGGISEQMTAEGFEGISKTRVHQLVKAALIEATAEKNDTAEELVTLEMLRLDDLTKGLYPAARKGETAAVNSMLNVMDRRARYAGIDAPTKSERAIYGKEDAPPIRTEVFVEDAARRFDLKVARAIATGDAERTASES